MNWLVVLIAGYLLTGLDLGLREGFQLGPTHIAPSFILPFVVFVALFAPQIGALWTGLIVGLVVDLSTQRGPEALVIVGPHALGYFVAAYFVISVRSIVIRRNPLTLAVLSVLAAALGNLIALALLTWRKLYGDPLGFTFSDESLQRLGSSLATGLSALVLALILYTMFPLFGFHDPNSRRFARRDT